jgi:uncharacterized protein YbbK (DUF523 family)
VNYPSAYLHRAGRTIGDKLAIGLRRQFVCGHSPSCGSRQIYDGSFSGRKIPGEGLAVEMLRSEGYKVFGEDEMEEAADYFEKVDNSI